MNSVLHFYDTVMNQVCGRLLNQIPPHYKYHSLRHTLDVIEMSAWIGQAEGLSEADMDILKVAALFHDTGFLFQRKNHEVASCQIFRETLNGHPFPPGAIEQIENCIMATAIPQKPNTLMEKILCDADLDYLGRDDFEDIAEQLFEELTACGEIETREQWNDIQVAFIAKQEFHTAHSRETRSPKLLANLNFVKQLNNK